MRTAVRLLALAAVAPALIVGSSAFSVDKVGVRAITASIVGDAAAYVSLAAYSGSTHKCFVSQDATTGKIVLSFASVGSTCDPAGTGQGISAGSGTKTSRYAFHDILLVTNKGTKPVYLWVNASTTSLSSSELQVAGASTASTMTDSSYSASTNFGGTAIAPGTARYVGVRLYSGTLTAGNDVTGTLQVLALAAGA